MKFPQFLHNFGKIFHFVCGVQGGVRCTKLQSRIINIADLFAILIFYLWDPVDVDQYDYLRTEAEIEVNITPANVLNVFHPKICWYNWFCFAAVHNIP